MKAKSEPEVEAALKPEIAAVAELAELAWPEVEPPEITVGTKVASSRFFLVSTNDNQL